MSIKHQLEIKVEDSGLFSYGQIVYVVESDNYKVLEDKCPVCEGTRKVTVKGFEFDCPYCSGYRSRQNATRLLVYNFEVNEYIINKIEIKGAIVKSAYNKDGSPKGDMVPTANYSGFTKWGNGGSDFRTRSFYSNDFRRTNADEVNLDFRHSEGFCFFDKETAEGFARRLHEMQKEKLDKFNEEHGSSHQYPYKI